MSFEINGSRTIDRPIEDVFEYVTTVENNEEWERRMVKSPAPDGEMAVETTWQAVVEGLTGNAEITMERIEYDPPTTFGHTIPYGMMGAESRPRERSTPPPR